MQAPMLGGGLPPPPQNVQLPPQMFTTAAQLLDMTDSKVFHFVNAWDGAGGLKGEDVQNIGGRDRGELSTREGDSSVLKT